MGYTQAQAKAFIDYISPMIVNEGKNRGYKVVSTVIAQAIIEGACGTSRLAREAHNHFGLKCGSAWKGDSITLSTKEEYQKGNLVTIKAKFRKYPNDMAGVAGYYDFISAKRYANLKTATTYREYAEYLKADGYATSSSYINTLCSTVEKYGLTVYDSGGEIVADKYIVGRTYRTNVDLYVRESPRGDKKKFNQLSPNAQKHGFADNEGYGILKKGTEVTCKAVTKMNGQTWIRIPSGWLCAINVNNKIYIE